MNTVTVDVQYGIDSPDCPDSASFRGWAEAACGPGEGPAELSIRIVDEQESAGLNETWRGKPGATNVLSFPGGPVPGVDLMHLGDLAICAPVVAREAAEQGKEALAHWAHMVVHGVLHLRGFDHETDAQAAEMETLEKEILAGLGFPDPYRT